MGILSALGLKKKDDHIEKELIMLKETVEKQNEENIDSIRTDIRTIFSELQSIKVELKDYTSGTEKTDMKISKLAERVVEFDNNMLKVVYKDEMDLIRKEFSFMQEDIKNIKDSQTQITDKFIDFALNKGEKTIEKTQNAHIELHSSLTEFEQELLNKYDSEMTSEIIVKETGMSKGHISRTLKGLCQKGYIERKRKGKEYIYYKK